MLASFGMRQTLAESPVIAGSQAAGSGWNKPRL
jgi:hypothetical protein